MSAHTLQTSTAPDCRMHVPRRRNTSTGQSWRSGGSSSCLDESSPHYVPAGHPWYTGSLRREAAAHMRTWYWSTHPTHMNEAETDTRNYKHGFGDPCLYETPNLKIVNSNINNLKVFLDQKLRTQLPNFPKWKMRKSSKTFGF